MHKNSIVINNFLEEKYFNKLYNLMCRQGEIFPWYYQHAVSYNDDGGQFLPIPNIWSYFHCHTFYELEADGSPGKKFSEHYDLLLPLLEKIKAIEGGGGIRSVLRMRANFYSNTGIIYEHLMHTDFPFSHTAAVLSLNTCDGYTKIADGTKLDSIANRVVFFDAGEEHCATSTTSMKNRFNIIVNYL